MNSETEQTAEDLSHPEFLNFPSLLKTIPEDTIIDLLSWLFIDEEILRNREVFLQQLLELADRHEMKVDFERLPAAEFSDALEALKQHGVRVSVEKKVVDIKRFCELAQQPHLLPLAFEAANFIPSDVEIDGSEPGPPSDGNRWKVLPLVDSTAKKSVMGARSVSSGDSSDTTHVGSAGEAWASFDVGNLDVHVPTCANSKIEVQAQRLNSVADYEDSGNPVTVQLDGDGNGNATFEGDQSGGGLAFLFRPL